MPEYLLLVEAVNLHHFLSDTNDLSTARGGSFLLLDAPGVAAGVLGPTTTLASGASRGIYSFTATDDTAAKQLCEKAQAKLRGHNQFRHATIMAAFVRRTTTFAVDEARLTARIRWQQMRSPSVSTAIDCAKPLEGVQRVCTLDRVRPAATKVSYPESDRRPDFVSSSVQTRRDHGRKEKQAFIANAAGSPGASIQFVHDLNQLSTHADSSHPLDGKIAILHADGNSFGATLRAALRAAAAPGFTEDTVLIDFNATLQSFARKFLAGLLDQSIGSDWHHEGDRQIEVLLWAGDDLTFIVPAWHGWSAMQLLQQHFAALEFRGKQLNYASSLIFCHHNAPIHSLLRLANSLLDEAKARGRSRNLVSYLILESFDHVGESLSEFRRRRCCGIESLSAPCLDGAKWEDIGGLFQDLKTGEFPRRRVYESLCSLLGGCAAKEVDDKNRHFLTSAQTDILAKLAPLVGGEAAVWLHLADLWDYAV